MSCVSHQIGARGSSEVDSKEFLRCNFKLLICSKAYALNTLAIGVVSAELLQQSASNKNELHSRFLGEILKFNFKTAKNRLSVPVELDF